MPTNKLFRQAEFTSLFTDALFHTPYVSENTAWFDEWLQDGKKVQIFQNRRAEKNNVTGRKPVINFI